MRNHGYSFDESGEGNGRPFDELTSQPGAAERAVVQRVPADPAAVRTSIAGVRPGADSGGDARELFALPEVFLQR
jgi:hypothetical protein